MAIALLLLATLASAATGLEDARPEQRQFVDQMSAKHGFDAAWVSALLAQAERREDILEAISRPAEKAKPWYEYRKIFVNELRIERGVEFWNEHDDLLRAIEVEYGVPPHIIVAILGVETHYGRITGRYRVLDSLATLAFHYPPRGAFFRSELEEFLLLTREEHLDPTAATGSYAGAMGAPQFISSSYRRYSIDQNGDGRRDLWSNWEDVLGSVANYFKEHGWQSHAPVVSPASLRNPDAARLADGKLAIENDLGELRAGGVNFASAESDDTDALLIELDGTDGPEYWVGYRNFYVITRYNRSRMYAMAVHQLGQEIASRVGHGER